MVFLKCVPSDFIVEEVSSVASKDGGKFLLFELKKEGLSTFEAVSCLSKALSVPLSAFSFAGLKDKQAVTSQVCSVFGVSRERLERVAVPKISVSFLGFRDEPVHRGELKGNKFKITLRGLDSLPKFQPRFRNLFGVQRFGRNNVEVGLALVRRDFKLACSLLKIDSSSDYVGALRKIPIKELLIYIHAFQSFLWNEAAMKTDALELEILGFGSQMSDPALKDACAKEGVKPSDFVIREFPELSSQGGVRKVWVEAKELKIGPLVYDDLHAGKKKVLIEFFLPAGCYATEFVRQNVSQ